MTMRLMAAGAGSVYHKGIHLVSIWKKKRISLSPGAYQAVAAQRTGRCGLLRRQRHEQELANVNVAFPAHAGL